MTLKLRAAAWAAVACLALSSLAARADDHAYTEGPVVNVASIRTLDGKFEDYMKFLSTKWKAEQELAKKAGDVISYEVLQVEPRGENDPDLYLVVRYENWAALDGALAKSDAIAKQVDGSVAASSQAQAERGKIRRVLGSETMQVLDLK